jgi:hypothetical protein
MPPNMPPSFFFPFSFSAASASSLPRVCADQARDFPDHREGSKLIPHSSPLRTCWADPILVARLILGDKFIRSLDVCIILGLAARLVRREFRCRHFPLILLFGLVFVDRLLRGWRQKSDTGSTQKHTKYSNPDHVSTVLLAQTWPE